MLPRMGRSRKVTRDSDQVTIRLPAGMRDEINRIAAENGRSANAEIVHRLTVSLEETDTEAAKAVRAAIREEMAALRALIEKKKSN